MHIVDIAFIWWNYYLICGMDARSFQLKHLQANTLTLIHANIISSRMFVFTTVISLKYHCRNIWWFIYVSQYTLYVF